MRRYFAIGLAVLLVGATYFTDFFVKKGKYFDENLRLNQENRDLQAQIAKIQILGVSPSESGSYLSARVFSTYPFNVKSEITIDAGKDKGVEKSMAVMLGKNILVGQVAAVFDDYGVVRTIFDPNWQLPARIGKEEINALFKGGNEPKAVLIEKDKNIRVGDAVYSASKDFSYGLELGEISEIRETSSGVFKEASLKIPFNAGDLREVNVVLKR